MTRIGKVVCVGRNYAGHARELNNPVPDVPIFFIKPGSSVVRMAPVIYLPKLCPSQLSSSQLSFSNKQGEDNTDGYTCHYECELALLIGKRLKQASPSEVMDAITAVGLGLDLTLRELQTQLKAQGHPWEKAKGFDGACPLSDWVQPQDHHWQNLSFSFSINGQEKQHGVVSDMLIGIESLVSAMSAWFTLEVGDVVLTGTPAGVGVLAAGDQYQAILKACAQTLLTVSGSVLRAGD